MTYPSNNRLYQDTESCGFYGPTILIQYAVGNEEPKIHDIWLEPVGKTLSLIEMIMHHSGGVVGFNNTHDSYHYNMTYGVLSMLPKLRKPEILDYYDCATEVSGRSKESYHEARDRFCVKPYKSIDLMLHGRKGEFQATLNQKDIRIRKVPRALALILVKELNARVKIPDIYFCRSKKGYSWDILPLHEETKKEITPTEIAKFREGEIKLRVDPNFVNLRLRFYPTTAMKAIVEKVLGYTDTDTISQMEELPKVEEHGWWPWCGDGWLKVINHHILSWTHNTRRRKYAKNDVVYLRAIDEYFGYPEMGDDDSELAFAVGAMYWRGFAIDVDLTKERLSKSNTEYNCIAQEVNVNSPIKVLSFLHEVCDPLEKIVVTDTQGDTLEAIQESEDWKETNPTLVKRASLVLKGRHISKEINLLEKLLKVGRLHVNFKVTGAKSNRMAGGSEGYLSKGGSINPQGIGNSIRDLFILAFSDMLLSGGDYDSNQIAIAEAVYQDENLRESLLKGLKFHGIMGSFYYKLPYEEILKSKDLKEGPKAYYANSKTADFAWLFGAMIPKLAQALKLPEEQVTEAFIEIENEFPGIKINRERIFQDYAALRQGERGGAITWKEPKDYVESFLGFRRYFTLEFSIIRALYDLAQEVYKGTASEELKEAGKYIKVVRTDRLQTGTGALCSSLYGAAFGIQGQVQRSAGNHGIQSPEANIVKGLQRTVWDFQPYGCKPWMVMPLNCHDELQCPTHPSIVHKVKESVDSYNERVKEKVPLSSMKWFINQKSWGKE
jgi:DNA polymerase I-like protein with 3'-5' exonuclease and polymerase domains